MTYYMELRRREEKGREEGRKEGRKEGREEGKAEGNAEGRWKVLMELVHDGIITVKEAAKGGHDRRGVPQAGHALMDATAYACKKHKRCASVVCAFRVFQCSLFQLDILYWQGIEVCS